MGRGKNLDALRTLPDEVLAEVVREGEIRLKAQFDAAGASDQRAMAWFGFLVTLTLASVGGAVTLYSSGRRLLLCYLIFAFALALAVAAFKAIECVRPNRFSFPGNLPENWLPEHWEAGQARTLQQARIEQARCLNNLIADNVEWAERVGAHLRLSIDVTLWALVLLVIGGVPALLLGD